MDGILVIINIRVNKTESCTKKWSEADFFVVMAGNRCFTATARKRKWRVFSRYLIRQ